MSEASAREFEASVHEFLRGARDPSRPFRPFAQFSAVADAMFLYAANEPSFLRRLDPTFSVLVSSKNPEKFTGFVVKGIRSLLAQAMPCERSAKAGKITVKLVIEEYIKSRPEVLAKTPQVLWGVGRLRKRVQEQELSLSS